ncbi:hypothetical protein TRIUR3_35451 [Triticum urartu]|uniref:Uncharacterized protein n=1 Tax=Triticum urartu TaxID=4572 RepID=M8B4P3_TRIUA|nr:hypothetical protein TRIUR3_35451 [Triticum urartu]
MSSMAVLQWSGRHFRGCDDGTTMEWAPVAVGVTSRGRRRCSGGAAGGAARQARLAGDQLILGVVSDLDVVVARGRGRLDP